MSRKSRRAMDRHSIPGLSSIVCHTRFLTDAESLSRSFYSYILVIVCEILVFRNFD